MDHDNLVVETHCDDAVLSIGGYLSAIKETGSTRLLNVFSTCVFTVIEGLEDPNEITRINNEEEVRFAGSVNADLHFMHLPEAMMRGYEKWNGYPDSNKELENMGVISRRVLSNTDKNNTKVFFPLSIGGHIDHRILFEVFNNLYRGGELGKVFLYEDLPYASDFHDAEILDFIRREAPTGVKPLLIEIDIDRKIDLASIYRSQYEPEYLHLLKDYASRFSQGQFFERLWVIE